MSSDVPADATSAGDGLDELQATRLSRQNRRPPMPKHPRLSEETSSTGGEGSPNDVASEEPPVSPIPSAVLASETATPARKSKAAAKAVAESVPDGDGPLTLVQVRVTESQLDYLDEIKAVAATQRLDVTDAAVIRLALRQLMSAQSPEQIVDRLGQPKARGRRGRPRH